MGNIRETSVFQMFLAKFNTFHRRSVGASRAHISNSHCWGFRYSSRIFGTTISAVILEKLRLPRAPQAPRQFHTLLNTEMTKTVEMSCARRMRVDITFPCNSS